MSDTKISGLPAASSVTGADTITLIQGGANKKGLLSVLATWMKTQVTKSDVGLGNADNTSDANKPVSTAQGTAISAAQSAAQAFATSADSTVLSTAEGYTDTAVAAAHLPQTIYVSKSGNDTTGTGSAGAPYLTVQKAATVIGSATTNGDFNDATKEFYRVVVDGGTYTETVTFGTRPCVLLDLGNAVITGDVIVQFNQGAISGAGLQAPKFTIAGDDLRSIAGGTPNTGVNGNVRVQTVGSGSSLVFNLNLKNIGITGDIKSELGSGGGVMTLGVYADRVIYSGDVKLGSGAGAVTFYPSNSNYSGSNSMGGVLNALLYQAHNVRFTRPVVTNIGNSASRWTNVAFASGANDFTGATAVVSADANTIESFMANVPSKGSITFAPLDTIRGIGGLAVVTAASVLDSTKYVTATLSDGSSVKLALAQ